MRIPHFVSKNTQAQYETSAETHWLKCEKNRTIEPENFNWDALFVPTLLTLCVEAIAKSFKDYPIFNELPCAEKEHLLECLPTNLPLELVVPLIQDEIYWERRYRDEFGQMNKRKFVNWTWKGKYLEKYISKKLEEAQPQYADEDMMDEFTQMINPYVFHIQVTELQPWAPPLYYEPEEIPDVWPIQHINFEPIFRKLENLVEVDITFGLKNIWETYKTSMFKVSIADIKHLGKAILHLHQLKILRLRRCAIEDNHVQQLMLCLVENISLEELDLSHCLIGDHGSLCIAKFITVHPNLKYLILTNNRIGGKGGIGLGYALMQETCAPLIKMDLRLNPLKHEGTMGILRALIRVPKLQELNIASVLFEEETPRRFAQMLSMNTSLKKVDVSCNYFDDEGVQHLLQAFQTNRVLEWLDVRECDIDDEYLAKFNKLLIRNRLGLEDEEDDEAVQQEELEIVEGDIVERTAVDEEDELDNMEKEESNEDKAE